MHIFPAVFPALALLSAAAVQAQYPPKPSKLNTIKSPVNKNVTIHYKTPPIGTCTTVFDTQKQYTGYVTLKPYSLAPIQQNYTVNTFFWFTEARVHPETAPLTIWLNGGPGSSSMIGMFQESGPCEVIEVAKGKLGTQARDWGFDRSSNVLYIDQPNMVGFSYDEVVHGVLDLEDGGISYRNKSELPMDALLLEGSFSSGNAYNTANTTEIAAHTIWHMLQGFLGAFPQYNPGVGPNNTAPGSVGINLFAESYGGKYGPAFASLWEENNEGRRNGTLPANETVEVKLTSLGIINGCVDDVVQGKFYPIFAANNTYGLQLLDMIEEQEVAASFIGEGGCKDQIERCRELVRSLDPESDGDSDEANNSCEQAAYACNANVLSASYPTDRDVYDVTQNATDPFPPAYYLEYLNTADVQAAIGVPINFTQSNPQVQGAFIDTGDSERGTQISDFAYLLSQGVRVALVYGDRDYICNWMGGEAVSFAIAAESPSYSPFYAAGYADIQTNDKYVGGVVRQYGNLSFSRVYNAGHLVPAYQPETAFQIFSRVILGNDIATGEKVDLSTFSTKGDANATYQNKVPDLNTPKCFIRNVASCESDVYDKLLAGHGVIINGVYYEKEDDWEAPASRTEVAGVPGTILSASSATASSLTSGSSATSTSSDVPTGAFTATTAPTASPTNAALPLAAYNLAATHGTTYLGILALACLL